jgi:uncharacterized peroxidase-related enzyme
MGFVPDSMLVMARDPELLAAFAVLAATIIVRPGRVRPGLKALIMYMVSRSSGCQYCAAHSANLAALRNVPTRKIEALAQFEQSPEFSEAERAALRFAQTAGHVANAVGDTEFAELRRHFDDDQILEMVAVLALLGFLNRWNDTLATRRGATEVCGVSPGSRWMDCGKAPGSYAGRTAITTTDPTARTAFLVATQALAAEAAVIEIQFTSGGQQHE